eukprot:TRINITY_DN2317_c0_g1_i1.p1 TRINITY_DN2317_c0_g1~~TRINITY_DN2317_c0_g1_i1.p1  ORF type:complete len:637 (+),score=85.32 TRINITY_DN2317_c0_g1_i1:143-2053(+)
MRAILGQQHQNAYKEEIYRQRNLLESLKTEFFARERKYLQTIIWYQQKTELRPQIKFGGPGMSLDSSKEQSQAIDGDKNVDILEKKIVKLKHKCARIPKFLNQIDELIEARDQFALRSTHLQNLVQTLKAKIVELEPNFKMDDDSNDSSWFASNPNAKIEAARLETAINSGIKPSIIADNLLVIIKQDNRVFQKVTNALSTAQSEIHSGDTTNPKRKSPNHNHDLNSIPLNKSIRSEESIVEEQNFVDGFTQTMDIQTQEIHIDVPTEELKKELEVTKSKLNDLLLSIENENKQMEVQLEENIKEDEEENVAFTVEDVRCDIEDVGPLQLEIATEPTAHLPILNHEISVHASIACRETSPSQVPHSSPTEQIRLQFDEMFSDRWPLLESDVVVKLHKKVANLRRRLYAYKQAEKEQCSASEVLNRIKIYSDLRLYLNGNRPLLDFANSSIESNGLDTLSLEQMHQDRSQNVNTLIDSLRKSLKERAELGLAFLTFSVLLKRQRSVILPSKKSEFSRRLREYMLSKLEVTVCLKRLLHAIWDTKDKNTKTSYLGETSWNVSIPHGTSFEREPPPPRPNTCLPHNTMRPRTLLFGKSSAGTLMVRKPFPPTKRLFSQRQRSQRRKTLTISDAKKVKRL